jgi:hypothetical protein
MRRQRFTTGEIETHYAAGAAAAPEERMPARRRDCRWIVAVGVGMILGWIVAPSVPGVVFKGSVRQISSICGSGLGALAQAANTRTASGCSAAAGWMTFFNVVGFAGLVAAVLGTVLVIRQRAA